MHAVALVIARADEAAAFCTKPAPGMSCYGAEPDAYAAYGLTRASAAQIAGPEVLAAGMRAAARGHFIGPPGREPRMLPGTFAIDAEGVVQAVHYARHAGDLPPLASLLSSLS